MSNNNGDTSIRLKVSVRDRLESHLKLIGPLRKKESMNSLLIRLIDFYEDSEKGGD